MNFKKPFGIAALILAASSATMSPAAQKKSDLPPLLIAINRHDATAVQRAIAQGADVNAPDNEVINFLRSEDTMLLHAMDLGHRDITLLLLMAPGIDVNLPGTRKTHAGDWTRTPLIHAASTGDAEVVSMLLKMGAKVNVRDSYSYSALLLAAMAFHNPALKVLLTEAKGLDIEMADRFGMNSLWYSSNDEDLDAVKLLHEHGAKINTTNRNGDSILTTTYQHKTREVLDYLVASGADINHFSKQGSTPLMTAIGGPDSKLAKTYYNFIDYFTATYKPKLDLQQIKKIPEGTAGGTAALHEAATFGNLDVINLLLDRGATLELKSLAGSSTALHYAVTHKKLEAARLLIRRKANIEARDSLGDTPLIHAVNNADPAMVQLLVDSGAAINVRSLSNVMVTPLVRAATDPNPFNHSNHLDIFNILLSAQGDIDFKSSDGSTALMAAARQSNTGQGFDRAALLINKGANLNLKNNKGETALMLATSVGNEKLVQLLLDKGADAKLKNGAGETVMSYAKRAPNQSSAALLQSQGVQPEAPVVLKTVIVDALLGTWTGFQDGLPQALYTIVLNKNGSYNFNSKLTAEAMKYIPKGSVINTTIAAHHGTYTVNDDALILNPVGTPPTSMHWMLEKGALILDNKIRLKKGGTRAK